MPQWGTRESPRPSLQPQKPPLPRGALAWLGRRTKGSETRSCRESLSCTLTLTFPITKMETKSLVHTADHGATAEPEAPTRPILPSTATSSPKEQAAGTPREKASLRTGPTSGLGSSHQHRPLHPQRLQTLQLKGPPQSAWQGKGPSARVSCPEGSRGPGRAESRRLLALVLAKERARGRLWAQACAPSLQGPRRRGRRVCAWPRGGQGRPGRNGQRPRRDLRPRSQGLCVFRSQAQALPLGVWTLGTTLSGVG